MKKRIIAAGIAFCIVCGSFLLPSSEIEAQNNDAKYDSYINMSTNNSGHATYVVPNLYRQDASYINVKTFPLVVSGGVDYFPLDIFALYPYLQVVYSNLTQGFYINNTKNNHYIAFDMTTGNTTTHDAQLQDIQAKIFNRTYYVPAAKVCEILDMNFESYDDPVNGIRAARVSDSKSKMTLPQLVVAYSPVKKDPAENTDPDTSDSTTQPSVDNADSKKPDVQTENQGASDNSPAHGTQTGNGKSQNDEKFPVHPLVPKEEDKSEDGKNGEKKPDKQDGNSAENGDDENQDNDAEKDNESNDDKPPEPVDPLKSVADRNMYLTFDVTDCMIAGNILDILDKKGIKATFFVDKDIILAYPNTVRRIISDGHSLGLEASFLASDGTVLSEEAIIHSFNEANDALYLVSKTKTRLIRSDYRHVGMIDESAFNQGVYSGGFELCDYHIDAHDGANYRPQQLEAFIQSVVGEKPRSARDLFVKFGTNAGTDDFLKALLQFTAEYPQFGFAVADEYTAKVSFIGG